MNRIAKILLVLTSMLLTCCTVVAQPPGFTLLGEFESHAYYVSDELATWLEARDMCTAAGGHLVCIGSAAENDFITALLPPYVGENTHVWIGFNDIDEEGNWVWVNGEPVVYTNWNAGEPNNIVWEDYGMIYAIPGHPWNGKWNDVGFQGYSFYCVLEAPIPCPDWACDIPPGIYRTETHGAWGQDRCRGHNFACTRDMYFDQVFPGGLTVGGGYTLHFTSSAAVGNFLPNGGHVAVLDASCVDPLPGIAGGTFASQVVALALNVDFGQADMGGFTDISTLVVRDGPFAHMDVAEILALANQVLGGDVNALPPGTSLHDLHSTVAAINEDFEGGVASRGYLVEACCPFDVQPSAKNAATPDPAMPFGSLEINNNPSNPTAIIHYRLNVAGNYTLNVYNVMGQLVTTLFDGTAKEGDYTITWNGHSNYGIPVSSGQYFVRLASRSDFLVGRLLLVR